MDIVLLDSEKKKSDHEYQRKHDERDPKKTVPVSKLLPGTGIGDVAD